MPVELASSALSRFTVLDLTRVRSGPICVRELADWGANVIKIETPPGLVKGEALERPDLVEHADYKSTALRSKNRDALNAVVEATTIGKTSVAWIELFNKIDLPSGPIYTIDQVFADEQVEHLGIAQDGIKPDGETQTSVDQPFGLSRTPSRIAAVPPDMGEHTDEMLTGFGLSDSDIAALRAAKAV
jgi:formyl-CoA transferase